MHILRTASVTTRLTLVACASLAVALGLIFLLLANALTREARAYRVESLLDHASGVAATIDAVDLTSRTMVERVFPVLSNLVGSNVRLESTSGQLFAGSTLVSGGSAIVDRFSTETGGVATIFAKEADGFRRVSTSLLKEDGTRAVGTLLDPNGAPATALSAGKSYSGRAVLFGKPYMTHYEVLRDGGQAVVGILFVGFEIGSFEAGVAEAVRRSRYFETGGTFLIDPRAGPAQAVFTEHETLKGRRVLEAYPSAGPFLDELATSRGRAIRSPGLLNAHGGDRWAVASRSAGTAQWVVAEVSDAEVMRETHAALRLYGALFAVATLALGGVVWALMRRQIGRPLIELTRVAQAVAAGDLSTPCVSSRADEIGQVVRGVEAMRANFHALLLRLRESVVSVSTASSEIAAGSGDLSGRTERAASHLQATSSSMKQLAATVDNTTRLATDAQGLAGGAVASTSQGSALMLEVVGTMQQITHSSGKISDITSEIDGIAFQTNILALNAAVEAARAGQQGRGFAVVAEEVRQLAHRSSRAAKEVKTLIEGSQQQVAIGGRLVQRAGTAMGVIEVDTRRVSELIGVIRNAATEQTDGIFAAAGAIGELEANIQQNASMVEQSSAATQSLSDQAQSLAGILDRFRL